MILTVIKQFAQHQVGDVISDAEKAAAILKSEFAHFVARTPAPDAEPQPSPEASAKSED